MVSFSVVKVVDVIGAQSMDTVDTEVILIGRNSRETETWEKYILDYRVTFLLLPDNQWQIFKLKQNTLR